VYGGGGGGGGGRGGERERDASEGGSEREIKREEEEEDTCQVLSESRWAGIIRGVLDFRMCSCCSYEKRERSIVCVCGCIRGSESWRFVIDLCVTLWSRLRILCVKF
jgi:hypothetical protein